MADGQHPKFGGNSQTENSTSDTNETYPGRHFRHSPPQNSKDIILLPSVITNKKRKPTWNGSKHTAIGPTWKHPYPLWLDLSRQTQEPKEMGASHTAHTSRMDASQTNHASSISRLLNTRIHGEFNNYDLVKDINRPSSPTDRAPSQRRDKIKLNPGKDWSGSPTRPSWLEPSRQQPMEITRRRELWDIPPTPTTRDAYLAWNFGR
ncbi:hypothetical protein MAR_033164 [Mya arenaria]|uniref:Uncharacterized protein n=1 Tax=Mya arenaria TaxID=6604 RepID=A0ABY7G873_MYAAR|nr:hypothetical protein MAR_033164 [Mya arenaria]